MPDAAKPDERELRFARVLLAADAFTRYPEDREESWHELCNACEAVTDEELEVLRGLA